MVEEKIKIKPRSKNLAEALKQSQLNKERILNMLRRCK